MKKTLFVLLVVLCLVGCGKVHTSNVGPKVDSTTIWENAVRDAKVVQAVQAAEAKRKSEEAKHQADADRVASIQPSYSDSQARYDESMGWGPEQQRQEEIANQ
jgi:hypothetical protein